MERLAAPFRRQERSVENCGRLLYEMVNSGIFELESTERMNAILGHHAKRQAPKPLQPFLQNDGRKTALVLVPAVREAVKFAEYVNGRIKQLPYDEREAFSTVLKYLNSK